MKQTLTSFRIVVLAIVLAGSGIADTTGTLPGSTRMLPGYIHEPLQGIDSRVGRIVKRGACTIHYDIGGMSGNYAQSAKKEALWYKEALFNGQPAQNSFKSDKTLIVSFPRSSANFYTTISREEDVVDFLLTTMTFPRTKRTLH
ncbi:MAG: hypothetical protein AMXMBFR84_25180 [Candidatus Hydrogenedentota bacterium]